jgi:hypothetical protein
MDEVDARKRVEESALAMLGYTLEQREQLFREAFVEVLARHPDVVEIPPYCVWYTAEAMARVAELERQVGTA